MNKNNTLGEALSYLEKIITKKKEFDNTSYTSKLLNNGIERISQKVGEEAIEVIISASTKNKHQVISESADLLYHLLVLWGKLNIKNSDVAEELFKRKK